MFFPPFTWPDDEITKEIIPQILIICPKCDYETVVDQNGPGSICGMCVKQGHHIDMIALGSD